MRALAPAARRGGAVEGQADESTCPAIARVDRRSGPRRRRRVRAGRSARAISGGRRRVGLASCRPVPAIAPLSRYGIDPDHTEDLQQSIQLEAPLRDTAATDMRCRDRCGIGCIGVPKPRRSRCARTCQRSTCTLPHDATVTSSRENLAASCLAMHRDRGLRDADLQVDVIEPAPDGGSARRSKLAPCLLGVRRNAIPISPRSLPLQRVRCLQR